MAAGKRQDTGNGSQTATGSGAVSPSDEPVPTRSTGWKYIAIWVAFAITFLLTVVLGIQVVIGTKGLG